MEQSPSWEANSHSANQETPRPLLNLEVHYRVHKGPPVPRPCVTFRNKLAFYRGELLPPRPTQKLEGHPLSVVCDCFNLNNQKYTNITPLTLKLSLCLTKHHAMKTYWGSGGIAPRSLDLGTRWRWVISFTPQPLYPQGKSPWYPLDRRLGGPQSRSGQGGKEKNSQPPPGIEP
jgi:hypothetical protein